MAEHVNRESTGRRKLPPLSPRSNLNETTDVQENAPRRKKKRKPVEDPEAVDSGVDGTPKERRRSQSRQRRDSGREGQAEKSDERNGKDVTTRGRPRPSPRRPSSRASEENEAPVDTQRSQRPRSRSKTKTASGSREVLVGQDDEVVDDPSGQTPRRKKKKRKPRAAEATETEEEVEVGLAAEISTIRDDIIVSDTATEVSTGTPYHASQAMRSQPMGKLFIEQKGGFKIEDKFKVAKRRAQQLAQKEQYTGVVVKSQNPLSLALSSQKIFRTFTLFCHGILAGFALWHIISVFMLNNVAGSSKEFLRLYQPVALPVQSLYYLLFVLCTVATFDRYDIGRPARRCMLRAVTIQSGAISVLVYFVSMLLSLSIAAIDDKIWLYKDDPTLWQDEQTRESDLNTWRIINTMRGCGAILGWFIISLKPTTDRLSKNLQDVDESIMGDAVEMANSGGV